MFFTAAVAAEAAAVDRYRISAGREHSAGPPTQHHAARQPPQLGRFFFLRFCSKPYIAHLECVRRVLGERVEVGGLHGDDLAVRERLEPGSTPRRAHAALPLARQASSVVDSTKTKNHRNISHTGQMGDFRFTLSRSVREDKRCLVCGVFTVAHVAGWEPYELHGTSYT